MPPPDAMEMFVHVRVAEAKKKHLFKIAKKIRRNMGSSRRWPWPGSGVT
jgi:hypothetical protein